MDDALDYRRFVRSRLSTQERSELQEVDRLAEALYTHLKQQAVLIDKVHVHRAKSSAVQEVVAQLLTGRLQFREEEVLPRHLGFPTSARPDFIFRLSEGRGIIAEVERGGTTTNNHDLKDLWKTHIADGAHHLFLVVPMANWKEDGRARELPFRRVCRRMQAFFGDPRREVDVVSLHVFGYGRSA